MIFDELFAMDEGFPAGIEALLPEGPLPPDEEARILARIREKAGVAFPGKGERKIVKKTKFGLMLFAAALVLGTVAASAAVYFQADRGLARSLGAEAESWQEFLDGSGTAIQASQECKGWTLTVNQAVGDRSCAYILLDLTAPEGVVLGADWYRMDCLLDFDGVSGGGWGCRMMEDEDKTDNRLSFLLDATMNGDLRDTTGHLKATGLVEFLDDDHAQALADLEWSFDFPMRYKNDPIVYRPNRSVQVERGLVKGTIKVETMEVTPLSVRVRLTSGDGILRRVEPLTAGTPKEGAVLLELRDKEGKTIPVDSTSGKDGFHSLDEVMTFVPILQPESIAAVVLDGVVIPLE